MPTPAYMSITGETQGDITKDVNSAESVGNAWQEAFKDQFMVQKYEHSLTVPCDPQSGQPTGQRILKPVIVTKAQDRSSPLLFTAAVTGEKLTKCDIHIYRTSTKGKQEHYYTITLIDAILVKIETSMPHCQDTSKLNYVMEEKLTFSYRAFECNHVVCGTAGSDDWRNPVL